MFFVQRMTSLLAMMYNEAQSLTLLDLVFAKEEEISDRPVNVDDFLLDKKDEEQPE